MCTQKIETSETIVAREQCIFYFILQFSFNEKRCKILMIPDCDVCRENNNPVKLAYFGDLMRRNILMKLIKVDYSPRMR